MENTIDKEYFLFCEVVEFEIFGYTIYKKDLKKSEKWRLIICIDGIFLDVKTGDEILFLPEDNYGNITGEIYANTLYANIVQKPTRDITAYELERGTEVYNNYIQIKKLIEEKKVIKFKQKRLF